MDALNKQYSEYALGMANTAYNIEPGLVVAGNQLSFQDDAQGLGVRSCNPTKSLLNYRHG